MGPLAEYTTRYQLSVKHNPGLGSYSHLASSAFVTRTIPPSECCHPFQLRTQGGTYIFTSTKFSKNSLNFAISVFFNPEFWLLDMELILNESVRELEQSHLVSRENILSCCCPFRFWPGIFAPS
jgi:hypothetical protein